MTAKKTNLKGTKTKRTNLLTIEWYNKQDLDAIRAYSKKTYFNLINFDDIFEIKYDSKTWFQRYWTHIKRIHPKNHKIYFDFLKGFLKRNYVFSEDCVRKLNIMSLTFRQYKKLIRKNKIRGIIIHREDCWLSNIIMYSRKLGIKIIVLNKEHVYDRDEKSSTYAKNLPFRCDIMLTGGTVSKIFWAKTINCDPGRIKIVGVPRFDQYKSRAKMSRKSFCELVGLNPDKKIIFFPSFHNTCVQREYFTNKKLFNKIYKPTDLEFAWPMREYYAWNLAQYKEDVLKALYELARANRDIQVLVKLHPDMHPTPIYCVKHELVALERKLKNFVGISSYNKKVDPREIMHHADLTIGDNSTMMLEGIMLKKHILQAKWGEAKKIKGMPIYELNCCQRAKNPEELKKKALEIVEKGENLKKYEQGRKKIIEMYFYKQDGKACERIFKELEKIF